MAMVDTFSGDSWRGANAGRKYEEVISDLNDRIVALEAHLAWEEELRKQNPALQDLYEKFQLTKTLVSDG